MCIFSHTFPIPKRVKSHSLGKETRMCILKKSPRWFKKCSLHPQPYFLSSENRFAWKLIFPLPNVTTQKVMVRKMWFVRQSWVRASIRQTRHPELHPSWADGQRAGGIIRAAPFFGHLPFRRIRMRMESVSWVLLLCVVLFNISTPYCCPAQHQPPLRRRPSAGHQGAAQAQVQWGEGAQHTKPSPVA